MQVTVYFTNDKTLEINCDATGMDEHSYMFGDIDEGSEEDSGVIPKYIIPVRNILYVVFTEEPEYS